MNYNEKQSQIVLAIDPTVRGFGFVVFDGPSNPVDWGKPAIHIAKNMRCLAKVKKLIAFHRPDVIVLESIERSLRCNRVKSLITAISKLAKSCQIKVSTYCKNDIARVFSEFDKKSKHDVAITIAEWLPELALRLPQRRKFSEPEDEHYGIFGAAALGLVHIYLGK